MIKEMTREDKLYSMTGANLILIADKLGIKVSANRTRTGLKEAKSKVIERILEAEAKLAEENTEQLESKESESIEEIVGQDSLEEQEADQKKFEEKPKKQKGQRGKLIEWNGKSQNLDAWARELGFTRQTLYARLYIQNWDVEKAFSTPGRKAK